MIPSVKICGITNLADAEAAIAAGAEYIGLIFAEESKRKVNRNAAQEIVDAVRGKVRTVGVFKDSPGELIGELFAELRLDLVQFHGNESPQLIRELALPSIKAFVIDQDFRWENVQMYAGTVDKILLDRAKNETAPGWLASALEIAASPPADTPPYFFAGGLTPGNVKSVMHSALATSSKFYGVDVASGVEKSAGVKDVLKMNEFCKTVREEAIKCGR